MARDESMAFGTALAIFCLGAAVGATAAILFAPAAGTETRAQIAEAAGGIKDKAGDLTNHVVERASQWRDKAASMIQRAQDRGNDMVADTEASGRRVAETVRREVPDTGA